MLHNKMLHKLNLQLFAETPAQQTEPVAEPVTEPIAEPKIAEPVAEPAQQPIDINEIVNNISSKISQTLNDRLSPIEERFNQPTPEQLRAQKEAMQEEFERDPITFIRKIQEEAQEKAKAQALQEIKSQYDPLIQQTEQLNNRLSWQDNVRNFIANNPQAQEYMEEISRVLQENPGLLNTSNPLDIAYKTAVSNNLLKGGNILDSILGNEEYKKQLMQNPQLKEAIIQEYQQGLNNGQGQGIPPLMGNNQTGSQIPASSGESPKNLKDAKESALKRLQQFRTMNMQ